LPPYERGEPGSGGPIDFVEPFAGLPPRFSMFQRLLNQEQGWTRGNMTATEVSVEIRAMRPQDAEPSGIACYDAHTSLAAAHNLPYEQVSVDYSINLMRAKLCDPNAYGVVADRDGSIEGSVFLNTFPGQPVASIGPLSVRPESEGGIGRQLMLNAIGEARRRAVSRIRLVQSPSHLRSLALYTKLGFVMREPLVLIQGTPPAARFPGRSIRWASAGDQGHCDSLCTTVHGFSRSFELAQAIRQSTAMVVEKNGRITGYSTGLGFRSHAVAETSEDLKVLISGSPVTHGPGFFAPVRNADLLSWLFDAGCRAAWPAALMTLGSYQEPRGSFLPSIAF
jgi:predicted N-acetyltransferase YhbS